MASRGLPKNVQVTPGVPFAVVETQDVNPVEGSLELPVSTYEAQGIS